MNSGKTDANGKPIMVLKPGAGNEAKFLKIFKQYATNFEKTPA